MYGASLTSERSDAHHARMQALFSKMDGQIDTWRNQFTTAGGSSGNGDYFGAHHQHHNGLGASSSSRPIGAPASGSTPSTFVNYRSHPMRGEGASQYALPTSSSSAAHHRTQQGPTRGGGGGYHHNVTSSSRDSTSIDNTFLEGGIGGFGGNTKENDKKVGARAQPHTEPRGKKKKQADGGDEDHDDDGRQFGNIPTGHALRDEVAAQRQIIDDLTRKNLVIASELLATREEAKEATSQLTAIRSEQKRLAASFEALSAAFTVTQQDNVEMKRRIESMERLFCSKMIPTAQQLTPQAIFGGAVASDSGYGDSSFASSSNNHHNPTANAPNNNNAAGGSGVGATINKFNAMNEPQHHNINNANRPAMAVQVNRNTAAIDVINEKLVLMDSRVAVLERSTVEDRTARAQLIEANVATAVDFAVIKLRKDIEGASAIAARLALSEERQLITASSAATAPNPKLASSATVAALQAHMAAVAERDAKAFAPDDIRAYEEQWHGRSPSAAGASGIGIGGGIGQSPPRAAGASSSYFGATSAAAAAGGGGRSAAIYTPPRVVASVGVNSMRGDTNNSQSPSPYTRASPEQLRDNYDAYRTELERMDRQRSHQSETERLRREEEALAFERDMQQQRQKLERELKAREEERRLIAERHEKEQREQDERRARQAAEIQERFNKARMGYEASVTAERERTERERQMLIDAHRKSLLGNLSYGDEGLLGNLSYGDEGEDDNLKKDTADAKKRQAPASSYFGVPAATATPEKASSSSYGVSPQASPARTSYYEPSVMKSPANVLAPAGIGSTATADYSYHPPPASAANNTSANNTHYYSTSHKQPSPTRSVLDDTMQALEKALGTDSSSGEEEQRGKGGDTNSSTERPANVGGAVGYFGAMSVPVDTSSSDDRQRSAVGNAKGGARDAAADAADSSKATTNANNTTAMLSSAHTNTNGMHSMMAGGGGAGDGHHRSAHESGKASADLSVNNTLPPLEVSALTNVNNFSRADMSAIGGVGVNHSSYSMLQQPKPLQASAHAANGGGNNVASQPKKKESIITSMQPSDGSSEEEDDDDEEDDDGLALPGSGPANTAKPQSWMMSPDHTPADRHSGADMKRPAFKDPLGGFDDDQTAPPPPPPVAQSIVGNGGMMNEAQSGRNRRAGSSSSSSSSSGSSSDFKIDPSPSSKPSLAQPPMGTKVDISLNNKSSGSTVSNVNLNNNERRSNESKHTESSGFAKTTNTSGGSALTLEKTVAEEEAEEEEDTSSSSSASGGRRRMGGMGLGGGGGARPTSSLGSSGGLGASRGHGPIPTLAATRNSNFHSSDEDGSAPSPVAANDKSTGSSSEGNDGGLRALKASMRAGSALGASAGRAGSANGLLDSRDVSPSAASARASQQRKAPAAKMRLGGMLAGSDEDSAESEKKEEGSDDDEGSEEDTQFRRGNTMRNHHNTNNATSRPTSGLGGGGSAMNLGGGIMMGGRRSASSRPLVGTFGALGNTLESVNLGSTLNSRPHSAAAANKQRRVGNNMDSDDDDEDEEETPRQQRQSVITPQRGGSSMRKIGNNFDSDDDDDD